MNTPNAAIKGSCHRPVIPASNWHGQQTSGYWMQIHAPATVKNGITFSELPEEGKFIEARFRVCAPAKSLRRFGALKSDESLENVYPVDGGDYAMCDFGDPSLKKGTGQLYNPLEDKKLLKNFLEPRPYTAKAHKLFSEYGFLYSDDAEELYRLTNVHKYPEHMRYAEHVQLWCAEFDRLQLARDMWSIMSNTEYEERKKTNLLCRVITDYSTCERGLWPGWENFIWSVCMPDDDEIFWNTAWEESFLEQLPKAPYYEYSYLLSSLVSHGIGDVRTSLFIDDTDRVSTQLVPRNLSGAVWIQFSEYMTENSKILTCRQCQQPFIRLRGKHRDAQYCGDACKQKAWRNSPQQKAQRQKRDQP